MKIKVTDNFSNKLACQIEYIAKDKPIAARKFKKELFQQINKIPSMPYKHRKSIYFDVENIRDLIFKGYAIVYQINSKEDVVVIFGFTKYQDQPFDK